MSQTTIKEIAPIDRTALIALSEKGKTNPGAVRTLKVKTVLESRFRHLNYVRNLPAHIIDEPPGLLGDDTAPNPSEAVLAALGSCLSVGIHANAVYRGIKLAKVELELEGDINITAVWGTGDVSPDKLVGFSAVRAKVRLEGDAPRETLNSLIAHADQWSPGEHLASSGSSNRNCCLSHVPDRNSSCHPMTHFAQLAEEQLRPDVHRIDREGYYPEAFLRALGAAGGFSAHAFRPEGLAEAIRITMAIGKHCGSTAFLVWCQNTCIWYLRNTSNVALRDRHLAEVVEAKTLGATAFSNPMKHYAGLEELRLKGRRVSGGYRVTGSLPWVSNLGLGHLFGTVFELEEEKIAALISVDEKTVRLGPSGQFIALEGTATHSLRFEEAFVPDSDVLGKPADPFVNRIRPGFILLQLGIGFGIIEGALDDIAHSEQNAKPADNYLPDGRETLRSALEGLIAAADRYALEPPH